MSIITRTRENADQLDTPLNHTEALDAIASDRHRHIIEFLAEQQPGTTVSISDLAGYVAAKENDCSIQGVTSDQRSRVYNAGHQQHYPKLDSLGYIEHDPDRGMVRSTPRLVRVWNGYSAF